jgi:hypothetical protein
MGEQPVRGHLRLIGCEAEDSAVVIPLNDAAAQTSDRRLLRSEAEAIQAQYGKNVYSEYLLRHGRRPDREEAAAIGRLLGGRVRAADGSMQPPLTAADRQVLRGIKSRRKAASRRYEHILRLRDAIAALSENEDDPADVIGDGSCLLDNPEIGSQLDIALCWLNRFAAEWHCREKSARTRDPKPIGEDQGQFGL